MAIMRNPEALYGRVYDFQVCKGIEELKLALSKINSFNFEITSVTQAADEYTVIFRRPLHG